MATPANPPNPTIAAANFFSTCARGLLNVDGAIHAEPLIASLARMSGSLMYRTFDIDPSIKPGTVVLSNQANTLSPKMMQVMFNALENLGDHVGREAIDKPYMSDTHSQLEVLESFERLVPSFRAFCEEKSLSFHDAAVAAAVATALCILECRQVLSTNKGASIAIFGLIEGTMMAPRLAGSLADAASRAAPKPKKPWYRFW